MSARLMALEALKKSRMDLHSCQAVIHLAGGFDPAYVRDAQAALGKMDEAIAALEAEFAQPVEPVWFACDTAGAEFDVTFVTTREEAEDAVCCALEDDPDLKFEDLVTPLYTAPQEPAVNAELSDDDIADLYFNRGCHLRAPGTEQQHKALIAFARAAIAKATGGAA